MATRRFLVGNSADDLVDFLIGTSAKGFFQGNSVGFTLGESGTNAFLSISGSTVTLDAGTFGDMYLFCENFAQFAADTVDVVATGAGGLSLRSDTGVYDLSILSGNDVIISTGATTDKVSFQAATVEKGLIQAGSAAFAIGSAAAVPFVVSSPSSTLALYGDTGLNIGVDTGSTIDLRWNGSEALLFTNPGGTEVIIASTLNNTLSMYPGVSTLGAGKAMMLRGGQGAASNAGGDLKLQFAPPGSGSSTRGKISLRDSSDTELGYISSYQNGNSIQIATTLLDLRLLADEVLHLEGTTEIRVTAPSATTPLSYYESGAAVRREYVGEGISAAGTTTTTILTIAMASNHGYTVRAYVQVANFSKTAASRFAKFFSAQNDAGTGQTTGSLGSIYADAIGSGENGGGGLLVQLVRSGTDILLQVVTPDNDTREASFSVEVDVIRFA